MTSRGALLLLLAIPAVFAAHLFRQGSVIAPHPNELEVGLPPATDAAPANRKFSDFSSVYIPEMALQLHGHRRGWLSLWNPHVELGRPAAQLAGLSRAYIVTNLLSRLTDDPLVLYTGYTLLVMLLTAVFGVAFLRSLELHPVACLCTAAGLAFGTFFAYWATFVMFLSTLCWTLALLWHVTRFVERRSAGHAAGIAFGTHSLLLTGYPQYAVYQFYLLAGYTLARLWRAGPASAARLRTAALLAGTVLAGVLTTLPVLADVALNARESARVAVPDTFFEVVLPAMRSPGDVSLYLGQLFDAFWYGNVSRAGYPFPFNGATLTPFYSGLILLSFAGGQWRRLWGWQLFVAACLLATLCPPVYLAMVHHLGFHFSRGVPVGGAAIPAFVLAGHGLDHVLRRGARHRWGVALLVALPTLFAAGAAASHADRLVPLFVALGLLITLGTVWLTLARSPAIAIGLTAISVGAYGFGIMLIRPLEQIRTTSPLVERLREATGGETRYAFFGDDCGLLLPPNQEALLGLRSIHTYNSLSSQRFQRFARQLSTRGTLTYGRIFGPLEDAEALEAPGLAQAGVGVIVSCRKPGPAGLDRIATVGRVDLYALSGLPQLESQTAHFARMGGEVIRAATTSEPTSERLRRQEAWDDFLRFRVASEPQETLLFVSQQYHPHWQARVNGRPVATVIVDGFYLGVVLPPQTSDVEIEFRPWSRWSWISQVFFAAVGLGLVTSRSETA
jgi:hypothetical protein